jgi:hypothetical protein
MNPVEHMGRRDDGFYPIGRRRSTHCDRLFQRSGAIVGLRQYVAMNIDHSGQVE